MIANNTRTLIWLAFASVMLAFPPTQSLIGQTTEKDASTQQSTQRIAKLPGSGRFKPWTSKPLDEPPVIPNKILREPISEKLQSSGSFETGSSFNGNALHAVPQQPNLDPVSLNSYPLNTRNQPLSRPSYQEQLRSEQRANQEEQAKKSLLNNGADTFNTPPRTFIESESSRFNPSPEMPSPPAATEFRSDDFAGSYDSRVQYSPANELDLSNELDLVQPPAPENQPGSYAKINPKQSNAEINPKQFWEQFPKVDPSDPKSRTAGYDSLTATLSNGFWFAGIDVLYLEPMFQDNNAFLQLGGAISTAEKVDFGFDASFRGYFGFETNAGPAIKFTFAKINEFSSLNRFTFTPTETAVTQIDLGSADSNFLFGNGAAPGSQLSIRQQIKLNISDIAFYKDQKNPVSRVRGNVGIRYVSLQQKLFAGLDDPVAGSSQVRNFNDYYGAGPRLGIEYFRPIGHTDFEIQSGFSGSLLFGRRDQTFDVTGTGATAFQQIGKVEPLSIFELYLGVQWNIKVNKCQRVYLRTAIESQLWAGSDTALDVGSDMGLYGMSFGFGITR